jgi:hypothetical protein
MRDDLYLCLRPKRNARPLTDDYGQGPLEDRIIFNLKNNNNDLNRSGGSVFKSLSSLTENQGNFSSRFFDLFRRVSDDSTFPVTIDYASSESQVINKLCNTFGFFIVKIRALDGSCNEGVSITISWRFRQFLYRFLVY